MRILQNVLSFIEEIEMFSKNGRMVEFLKIDFCFQKNLSRG